jgi:hypothetical protein
MQIQMVCEGSFYVFLMENGTYFPRLKNDISSLLKRCKEYNNRAADILIWRAREKAIGLLSKFDAETRSNLLNGLSIMMKENLQRGAMSIT